MTLGEDIRWVFAGFLFAFVVVYTLAIVVTSWWGWSTALACGVYVEDSTTGIFRHTTLLFLIDIALLVCYYTLLLGIRHVKADLRLRSIRHTVFWTAIIFGGYFLWDFLLVLKPSETPATWQHAYASAVWTALAAVAYLMLRGVTPSGSLVVYGTYTALFCLLLAFRLFKITVPWSEFPKTSWFLWLSVAFLGAFGVLTPLLQFRRRAPR